MENGHLWITGPGGEEPGEDTGLLSLVRRSVLGGPRETVVVVPPVICPMCDAEQYEVAGTECYCEGCCLPLGVSDGEIYPAAFPWRLVPAADAPQGPAGDADPSADVACPAGHAVFEVAAAFALGADDEVRRLSVGLRCPVDGALALLVDNVHVVPRVR